MKILHESKSILSYAGLGTDKSVQIFKVNVPRIIVWIAILLALVLCLILEILICVHNFEHGIGAVLLPVCVIFSFIALILTYTTLIQKVKKIVELMEYLEYFTNKSNEFK